MTQASYSYAGATADQRLDVRFALLPGSVPREVPTESVLDFDEWGSLIGIELLSPSAQLGVGPKSLQVLSSSESPMLEVSYDEGSDALYLRLANGRSREQKVLPATLRISADGFVSLSVGIA